MGFLSMARRAKERRLAEEAAGVLQPGMPGWTPPSPEGEMELPTGERLTYVPEEISTTGASGWMEGKLPPMGFWSHARGRKNIRGRQGMPPSRMAGWTWTPQPVTTGRPPPQVFVHEAPVRIPPRNGAVMMPRDRLGYPGNGWGTTMRLGWWQEQDTGRIYQGTSRQKPSAVGRWKWTQTRPGPLGQEPDRLRGPDLFTGQPTEEVRRIDALPATPPPGPAVAPEEPWWRAILGRLAEQQAAPVQQLPGAPTPTIIRVPGAPAPAAPEVRPAFNIATLAIPAALIAGMFFLKR